MMAAKTLVRHYLWAPVLLILVDFIAGKDWLG